MIFAKLDVCFHDHPRFVRAGLEACGYWAAVLSWLRRNDSEDGTIPFACIGLPLNVGDRKARQLAEKLVEIGLFARHETGYELLRYSDKNETADEIEARRRRVREKVARHRSKPRLIGHHGDGDNTQVRVPQGNTAAAAADVTQDVTGYMTGYIDGSVTGYKAVTDQPCNPPVTGDRARDQSQSQRSERSPPGGPPPEKRISKNATDDGAFGLAVAAWAEGVREATGRPFALHAGSATQSVVAALVAHQPDANYRVEWARDQGRRWAKSRSGRVLKPFDFADWLNSGSPESASGTHRVSVQPGDAQQYAAWAKGDGK